MNLGTMRNRRTNQMSQSLLKEIEKERNDGTHLTREDVERLDASLGVAPPRTDEDTKALP